MCIAICGWFFNPYNTNIHIYWFSRLIFIYSLIKSFMNFSDHLNTLLLDMYDWILFGKN